MFLLIIIKYFALLKFEYQVIKNRLFKEYYQYINNYKFNY